MTVHTPEAGAFPPLPAAVAVEAVEGFFKSSPADVELTLIAASIAPDDFRLDPGKGDYFL